MIQAAIARDTFQSLEYFLHLFPPLPPPLLKLGCGLSAFNNLHRFCEFTFYAEQTAEKTQADISFTNPLAVGSGLKGTPSKSRGHLGISGQNPNLTDTGNISKLLKFQF